MLHDSGGAAKSSNKKAATCGRAKKDYILQDEAHAAFAAGCAGYSLAKLNQIGMRVSHFMRVAAIRPIPAKIAVRS